MNKYIYIYLFVYGALLVSCNLQNSTSIVDVKYEVNINPDESKTLNFSKTADFIKYVPLETTKEALIKHVEKMFITDSLIIIFDDMLSDIFLFDQEGKYINKCGRKGEGPGEHILFNDVSFDKSTNLVFAHEAIKRVMYIYNMSGDLIREIPTDHIWFRSFCKVDNGYWIYTGYNNDDTDNSLLKVDDDFAIIRGQFPQKVFFRTIIHSTFIQKENEKYFISPYDNIIYRIYNDSLAPYIRIDFGDKTLPYEKIATFSDEKEYNKLIEKNNYLGYLGDFLFYRDQLYFTFSSISENSLQYIACYDIELNKVNIYDGYSLYRKKNFKFNDMTFMQPKATFENDLVFLIHPYELQEKDMQILQEDVRFHVDLDSNPILFFMRY